MDARACLKTEFTEDEKYHNLMRSLKYCLNQFVITAAIDFILFLQLTVQKGNLG